jgi:hypothetical protein
MPKRKVPLGKAIRWTDADKRQLADLEQAQEAAATAWAKDAPPELKRLLDAKSSS